MTVPQLSSLSHECTTRVVAASLPPECSLKVLHACVLLPQKTVDCHQQLSSAAHLGHSHMRAVPALYSLHVLLGAHVLPV